MRRRQIGMFSLLVALTLCASFSSAASAATASPDRAVPSGFRAQSVTFVTPAIGWVLGNAPCTRGACTGVIGTADGGATWSGLGSIPTPLAPSGEPGVTELRFADDFHAWAYGPSFWSSVDGGRSWHKEPIPGGGRQVLAVAADVGVVYILVSPCRIGHPLFNCTEPTTLWRSAVAGISWTRVPITLPIANVGVLAVLGTVAYVVVPQPVPTPDASFATTDGVTWEPWPSPCSKAQDEVLTDVAPISSSSLALLCVGDPSFSQAVKHVFRSVDNSQTTTSAGTTPLLGIQSDLAAAPDGTLAVSSVSSGGWVYLNPHGRHWSTSLVEADGGQGLNDLIFTSSTSAFVIHGPAALSADRPGELLHGSNGGVDWAPVDLQGG